MKLNPAPCEEPTWCIEKPKPGDGPQVAHVHRESWLATYPDPSVGLTYEDIDVHSSNFITKEGIASWENTIANLGDAKQMWVARDLGKIVGYCVATKSEKEYELRAIYILPEYNGKGVGPALMKQALEWLGDEREIVLWAFIHNKRALAFYRKCGFNESGREAELEISGKMIPDVEMVRTVKKNN